VLDTFRVFKLNSILLNQPVNWYLLLTLSFLLVVLQLKTAGGHTVTVPFARAYDASQEQTDVESFAVLEAEADGFRNYTKTSIQYLQRKC
jgi:catalase (peroxidase I)